MRLSAHDLHKKLQSFLLALLLGALGAACASAGDERQVMAARILKFARYVEFSKDKMKAEGPFVIGVFGQDRIYDYIREATGSQKIKNRDVEVKRIATMQEIAGCHVIFISTSDPSTMRSAIREAKSEKVLSVGQGDSFEKDGGVITLLTGGDGSQFTVNRKNAAKARLELGADILDMAEMPLLK
jgi:ABC-type sugar transport system substrate-binding protein